MTKSRKLFTISLVLMVMISIGIGFLIGTRSDIENVTSENALSRESINLIQEAYLKLKNNYIDEIDEKEFVYGAISGGFRVSGDSYTSFLPPDLSEDFARELSGELEGIGIRIGILEEFPAVISPLKNSPAEKAGLRPRDLIIKVDDMETGDIPLDEVVAKIRGPKGTKVKLEILRNDQVLNFEIERDEISVTTVEVNYLRDDVAHLIISEFGINTLSEFDKIADEILEKGVERVVVDLRNNPGGLLDSTIKIAGYFHERDKVAVIEKTQDEEVEHKTNGPGTLKNMKLVTLVNQGSASAAEILAGSFQDNDRGLVIGERTFGKGTVQQLEFLSGGSAVKITVAKWLTPDGTDIEKEGVEPDIIIEEAENHLFSSQDPILKRAVDELIQL